MSKPYGDDVWIIHGPSGCPDHGIQVDVKSKLSYCPTRDCFWIRVVDMDWVAQAETAQGLNARIDALVEVTS